MASSTAVAFQRLTDTSSVMDALHKDVLSLILKYVDDERDENPYIYRRQLTFIANIMAAYATQITYNLIWNIKVDETLAFAENNRASLNMKTAIIKDPYGQKLQQTPLIALQMAGDRNPRELKDDEKDYGLVEKLRSLDIKLGDTQLAKWRRGSEKVSNIIKAPIIAAMKILCQQIIDSKEITTYADFEKYLNSSIAEQFREALKPDPYHVARGGFLFPWTIFLNFMEIFEKNVNNEKVPDKNRPNLGGWWSLKSDVFDAIVYPALQARVPRCDLPHLNKGIGNIDAKGMPKRIDFSKGTPEDLKGLGRIFFFGLSGDKFLCGARVGAGAGADVGVGVARREYFTTYIKQKNQLWNYAPTARPASASDEVRDNVILDSSHTTNAANL